MNNNQNNIKILSLILVLVLGILIGTNMKSSRSIISTNDQKGAIIESQKIEDQEPVISEKKYKTSCKPSGATLVTEVTGSGLLGINPPYTTTVLSSSGTIQTGDVCTTVEA